MRFLTLATLIFGSALTANATTLNCHVNVNNELRFQTQVQTQTKQRTYIGDTDTATAYITEKVDGVFTIEAFVADIEARIYGEGVLKSKTDRLSASLWTRTGVLDVECSPAN
jgi:hypothetical protein